MFSNRSLLVSIVLLGLTFGKCSAERTSLPVEWDVRMGPSLTGVSNELANRLDGDGGGFDGGIGIRWPRSARFASVQGEVLLASRARDFEDMVRSGIGSGKRLRRSLQVLYAQSTMLARASLHRGGKLRPYALAGPYFAWHLSSRIAPGTYVGDEPVNPGDVRARDAGAIIGLGSDLMTGPGRATIEVRVSLGLVDVLENRAGVEGAYRAFTLLLAFTPSR
jgi:hypothetical protein